MVNIKILFSLIVFISTPLLCAAQSNWTETYEQGNLEYAINVNKFKLTIDCPTENGAADRPSSVSVSVSGKELPTFELLVNGKKYTGPFETGNKVGDSNFIELLEDLKKSDAKAEFKGASITFPKSNAHIILPTYGKKGFQCNLDGANSFAATPNKIDRPQDPLAYGKCYGGIIGWAKKSSGGLITNQKAVDFHKTWQPYAAQVAAAATKAGGCVGNFNDAELLQCYKKRLPDTRDATFQWAFNLGIEHVMEAPAAAAPMLAQLQCGPLIGFNNKPKTSSGPTGNSTSAPQPSSGTITRIDNTTGNVAISGFSRVTVGKGTSITVNGSQVRNEGDLMVGDKCIVRMEATDLYARNLICTR